MDWREEALDVLLKGAFDQYDKALKSGTALALETHYADWVDKALTETVELPSPKNE